MGRNELLCGALPWAALDARSEGDGWQPGRVAVRAPTGRV